MEHNETLREAKARELRRMREAYGRLCAHDRAEAERRAEREWFRTLSQSDRADTVALRVARDVVRLVGKPEAVRMLRHVANADVLSSISAVV